MTYKYDPRDFQDPRQIEITQAAKEAKAQLRTTTRFNEIKKYQQLLTNDAITQSEFEIELKFINRQFNA